jgi:hypothetical protein
MASQVFQMSLLFLSQRLELEVLTEGLHSFNPPRTRLWQAKMAQIQLLVVVLLERHRTHLMPVFDMDWSESYSDCLLQRSISIRSYLSLPTVQRYLAEDLAHWYLRGTCLKRVREAR